MPKRAGVVQGQCLALSHIGLEGSLVLGTYAFPKMICLREADIGNTRRTPLPTWQNLLLVKDSQSQKCAINHLRIKIPVGLLG